MNLSRALAVIVAAAALAAILGLLVSRQSAAPTLAQAASLTVCPPPVKWAMSVWLGNDNTPTGQAAATCSTSPVESVWWLNHDTQLWEGYATDPAIPEVARGSLTKVNRYQPLMLKGKAAPQPTATPTPTPTRTATPTPTPCVPGTGVPCPTPTPTPTPVVEGPCDLTISKTSTPGLPGPGTITYTIRVDWVCSPLAAYNTPAVVHVDDALPLKPPVANQQPYVYTPNGSPQVTFTSASSGSIGCTGPSHSHPGGPGFDTNRFGCDVGVLPPNGYATIRVSLDTGGNQPSIVNTAVVDTSNVIPESNEGNNQAQKTDLNCC